MDHFGKRFRIQSQRVFWELKGIVRRILVSSLRMVCPLTKIYIQTEAEWALWDLKTVNTNSPCPRLISKAKTLTLEVHPILKSSPYIPVILTKVRNTQFSTWTLISVEASPVKFSSKITCNNIWTQTRHRNWLLNNNNCSNRLFYQILLSLITHMKSLWALINKWQSWLNSRRSHF